MTSCLRTRGRGQSHWISPTSSVATRRRTRPWCWRCRRTSRRRSCPVCARRTVSRATVNVHFAVEPPFGVRADHGPAQWRRPIGCLRSTGRLSVTISGAERLLDTPHEALAKTIWAEVAQAASLPLEPMPAWQVVMEKRATFAAVPDQETLRPGTRTRWNNLMLAGDWTATGLPATIEGAIRSGQKAADTLLNRTDGTPMNDLSLAQPTGRRPA